VGAPINMVAPDGTTHAVPVEQYADAVASGFTTETEAGHASRLTSDVKRDIYGGVGGKVVSAGAGLLRGATLGGSDVVFDALGGGEDLQALREENKGISIGAEILGGLSPIGPAGMLSKAGRAVAGLGEGAGVVGRAAYSAGGAALEGAGQSAGSYLSSVALEDKPLSAEGFVGAMGGGALFAGGLGASLSLAETTLMRAKALFPQREVTREAAKQVERQATSELSTLASDGQTMQSAAKQRLEQLKIEHAEARLATERELGALDIQTKAAKLEREQALTARAKNPPKRTRKAFDEPAAPPATDAPPMSGEVPAAAPSAASAPAIPAASAEDDLLAKLQGTKAGVDQGKTLQEIASGNPEAAKLIDAQAAHAAALDEYQAWLAKYGKGTAVEKFERGQKARAWADDVRPKESGYYTKLPEGEAGSNMLVQRGYQKEFRGTAAEQAAAEAKITTKVSPEERLAAEQAVAESAARRSGKTIGEQIVDHATEPKNLDDSIAAALKPHIGEHANVEPDLAEAAQVIGKVESTSADLAEALGSAAPGAAKERAAAFRDATAAKAESDAAAAVHTADAIGNKLAPEVARKTGGIMDGDAMSKLGDLGAGLEVLKAMGIAVPDVEKVPVLGPVLSMYLKARAALGVFKRAGGSVPKTAEAVIAGKKAATMNRINASVTRMLDIGAAGTRQAQKAAGPLAALSSKLFPGGETSKKGDAQAQYRARVDELARATQPGAVMQAVRDHVQTSDPMLQQEIASALERKLAFLNSKMPRQTTMPTLLKGDGEWRPSKAQLHVVAEYMRAAEDPASVLEDVAAGKRVSIEAAETLRKVYPSLYREAQMTLLDKAQTMQQTLPYTRRVALSVLFQVPVDGTMSASHITFLQGPPKAAAQPAAPQGLPPQGAQPIPTVAGQMNLGDRTMTALDRRAGA